MATKSSKIAVTLQPTLKQKLREYGKENQIKNFSGVILAILDDYFGGAVEPPSTSSSSETSNVTELLSAIQSLTTRVEKLEGDTATTSVEKSKPILKSKPAAKGRGSSRSSDAVDEPVEKSVKKTSTRTSSRGSSASKSRSTSAVKSSSKSAPSRKTKASSSRRTTAASTPKPLKTTAKSASATKSTASKSSTGTNWMSTREAFNMYGGDLSWSRFSKLTPEELKERFNLDSDLSRKVRGSRFNQWLKPGK